MDLSTHALTPGIDAARIRSLSRLDRRYFGEYELSPSLIGLSPPPSAHPEAFQRLLVRPSIWCYPYFSLAKGRSLGFASAPPDWTPYSDSLSLRLQDSCPLTSPGKATRRFIMQKARRHCTKQLRPLVGTWFQGLFHSPVRGAFPIGLSGVFSLAGWSRRIHAGFLVSRATQDTTTLHAATRTQLSCSTAPLSRGFRSRHSMRRRGPTTPALP